MKLNQMYRRSFLALTIGSPLLLLSACGGPTAVVLLTAIVAAGEILIDSPAIDNLTPAQAAQIIQDANQALAIVTNLIDNGINTQSIEAAVTALTTLLMNIPAISDSGVLPLITAFTTAIVAFLKAYQANPNAITGEDVLKQMPKLQALSGRAHMDLNRGMLRGTKVRARIKQ